MDERRLVLAEPKVTVSPLGDVTVKSRLPLCKGKVSGGCSSGWSELTQVDTER